MDIVRGIFLLIMMAGIVMIVIYYIINKQIENKQKIIYKYIPRTLDQEQLDPIYVSEIFETMFSQPSVWIESINDDAKRNKDVLNKYFISQK
jgi:predicted PurR-regulated permease PerM